MSGECRYDTLLSTAPGLLSDGFQQPTVVAAVVVGISGLANHVATRRGSPPNIAETICHGGTSRREGLEINCTPPESLALVTVWLFER